MGVSFKDSASFGKGKGYKYIYSLYLNSVGNDVVEMFRRNMADRSSNYGDAKRLYMAWGYEKSFVVEHVEFTKKKLSCKDCCYYEKDDKSCLKRPLYLPEDGYNSWKNCRYFEPTRDAIKSKKDQVEKYVNKTNMVKSTSSKHDKESQKDKSKAVNVNIHAGDIIKHKAYGKGKVLKIKDNRIFVSFNGSEKMFYFPDAFEKGFFKEIAASINETKVGQAWNAGKEWMKKQ